MMLVLAALATACSDDRQPLLIDEDDAITAYEFHVRPGDGVSVSEEQLSEIESAAATAVPPPDGWDLRIAWGALPCQNAPTVRVTASGGRITAIDVDKGPQLGPGECPSSLVVFGVDLRTSLAVPDDLVVTGGS